MTEILKVVDQLLTLSTSALVLGACIVMGYVLRLIKAFPNGGIPLAVILTGALGMLLLSDPPPSGTLARVWVTRHIIAGLIAGFIAWMAHKMIISRFEDWISKRFALFGGGDSTVKTPPAPPNDQTP